MAFDLATASPLLEQFSKSKDAPAATTPDPKIPEKGVTASPAAPAMTPPTPLPDATGGTRSALGKIADLEKERDSFHPPKPDLPKRPNTSPQEGLSMWGALAIAFAGLASLRTRRPMTSALNAAGAAFQGMQAGQHEKAEQAFKQWEMDMKVALETAQYEREAYNDVMSKFDRHEKLLLEAGGLEDRETAAKMKAMTESLQDPLMWQEYQRGGVAGAAALQKQREQQAQKLKEQELELKAGYQQAVGMRMLEQSPEYQEALQKKDISTLMSLRYDVIAKTNPKKAAQMQNEVFMSPEEIDRTANMIAGYKMTRDQFLGKIPAKFRTAATIEALDKKVSELNPDWNPSEERRVGLAVRDLTVGAGAKNITALSQLSQHMETMESLVDNLPNDFDAKALNSAYQVWARQNDVDLAKYNTAAEAVNSELVKVLSGASGGSLTDRERSAVNFAPNLTKAQLRGNIDTIKHLAAARINTIRGQYRDVPDIDKYFPPGVTQFFGAKDTKKGEKSSTTEGDTPTPERISVKESGDTKKPPPPGASTSVQAKDPEGKEHTLYKTGSGWVDEDGKPVQ